MHAFGRTPQVSLSNRIKKEAVSKDKLRQPFFLIMTGTRKFC
jgi:hypothetical protein